MLNSVLTHYQIPTVMKNDQLSNMEANVKFSLQCNNDEGQRKSIGKKSNGRGVKFSSHISC